jgi:hypothetical protein
MKFELVAENLIYQLIVFWFFFAFYRIIGFNAKNFTFSNNRENREDADLMTTLWYTVATHTRLGSRDVAPTSPGSRAISSIHALATYLFGPTSVYNLVSPHAA